MRGKRSIAIRLCCHVAMLLASAGILAAQEPAYPALYPDEAPFARALESVPAIPEAKDHKVTGIVVPHHLVGADLMALGFRAAAGREVKRILLLTPEHFMRSRTPLVTTRRGFETVWGTVPVDTAAIDKLMAASLPISESDLFEKEHGVHALLPFIARLFPDAAVVPVGLRIDSKEEHWKPLVDALLPLVDDSTLIVQSTDFSHYLELDHARMHDQETMAALVTGEPGVVMGLNQPDHLDSRAAQYVHMELQRRLGNSGPVVIGNRNSQDYSRIIQERTTSYIAQVFEKEPGPGWPVRKGEELWYFAGDTFFGRHVFAALSKPERAAEVLGRVKRITRGAPLVVNLEGVMVPKVADPRAQRPLAMDQEFALKCLKDLGVKVACLANNHALDLGPEARAHSAALLKENGIEPLLDRQSLDLGKFRITGLTDICNESAPMFNRLSEEDLGIARNEPGAGKPTFLMIHWGVEWEAAIGERQQYLLDRLVAPLPSTVIHGAEGEMILQSRPSALSLILGSHPHVASKELSLHSKVLVAPTMGNLIFDQPRGSGALIEVRFFPCGTYAVRQIPLGNVLKAVVAGEPHSSS